MEDLERARAAMARAADAGGVGRAPDLCARARSTLMRAEAELSVQGRRLRPRRDYGEATRLASGARREAEICALEAQAARNRTRDRATRTLDSLAAMQRRVASLSRQVADDDVGEDLLQADIALGEARAAFEKTQYERASESAARGEARLAAALSGITRLVAAYEASPRRASWKRWVGATLGESARTGETVILVDKLRRELLVYRGADELATYPIDLGIGGMSSKIRAGDDATPEGRYRITEVRGPGQTHYYRALMLDYPNPEDLARFRRLKRAGRVSGGDEVGSLIEIHGHGGRSQDWTRGCVALHNDDMDDLVPRVRVGTRVTIVGTIPVEALP